MTILMWSHIVGGSLAILSGTAALAARKGGPLHVRAGTVFAASMLVLGVTAAVLSWGQDPPESGLGGVFTVYFVATSWVAARRHQGRTGRFEIVACAVALAAGVLTAWGGVTAVEAPTPVGRGPVFALAALCLLAGGLDLNAVLRGALSATQRLSRHLWRMCVAFFIATGSFFLGQQDVMPEAVRGSPVLFLLAFAPVAAMLLWLARLRLARIDARGTPAGPSAIDPSS
ncbi:MAG: hypothetical protein ACOY5Y_08725 [Pseudomonadota bacterium]